MYCIRQILGLGVLTSNLTKNANKNPYKLYNNIKKAGSKIKMGRNLAAFDFDHTIVDDNTDIVVRNLIAKDDIPLSLKKLYRDDGWTSYMQGVFEILHLKGFNESSVVSAIEGIKPTPGFPELLKHLSEKLNYDIIIISDSNSFLINAWLDKHELKNYVKKVFTNPAEYHHGVLHIEMYHLQTDCKLSTKNLCKGRILDEYLKEQREDGNDYNKIVYVGDGTNDFCPILRLKEQDLACVRDKYNCSELVNRVKEGKPIASTGETYQLKANVLVWKDGFEILDRVKTL